MNQCLIEGCENEAFLVAKSGRRSYYSCSEHKKYVAQIVASEHTKAELERINKIYLTLYSEKKEEIPKWIKV